MDELFAKYEHELVILRSLCREYAQRYPKVAARLQMGGDTCDDPHVERLIQAVALLCSRVTKRLDDSYPQFTEALLNLLFPHYLRPFPSCAIVRFCDAPGSATQVARGTKLESKPMGGVPCTFTTAYALAPSHFALVSARYAPIIDPPAATRLPPDATSCLTLVFTSSTPGTPPCTELNLLSQAMDVAFDLRRKLFKQCTDDDGPAQFGDMEETFKKWLKLMEKNTTAMANGLPLQGQIARFHVDRKPGAPVI